ncbi:AIPR family protein [Cellulomonas iranensis]|uniref:AIPR family protein n=1 Tax=Cellulomonas iranensis TaxID=76862 RepID=UPI001CF0FD83|nr:AIPR family protein [Cellulomonas iranensis]UCN15305.1 AIPR family protein [Cellulomonas iranensis]
MTVITDALQAYEARDDLQPFSPNSLLLFALQLRFGIDDIPSVAATAITDGGGDHKCDLLYIDAESRTAVIAQCYESTSARRSEAPANKAADLGTAASWIIGNQVPELLGENLREAAFDLHESIAAGDIDMVELWYVHNLPGSDNCKRELARASAAAKALLDSHYEGNTVSVAYIEVGREQLDEWYTGTQSPILVTDSIDVPANDWFLETGDGWTAICTSVPATWLQEMHRTYGDKLFSANVRSILPSRRTALNINHGIERTAKESPGRFWAFNNGVTALVNAIVDYEPGSGIRVSGLAIVNGAQTTGALARVDERALVDARVLIRFVQSIDHDLVDQVIRYNNSQNPIKPSDFRSRDRVQQRLRQEFARIPGVTYLGARRGGPEDRARHHADLLASDTAAQALAAFHQDPATAYHDLRGIWEDDGTYARYFSDHTHADHIVFCYSLWRVITEKKNALGAADEAHRTDDDRLALEYFRKRGSLHLLTAAVANSVEVYLDRPVANPFDISFGSGTSPASATEIWEPVVDAVLPFAPEQLGPVFSNGGGLRRRESVERSVSTFRSVVRSTRRANSQVFAEFAENVVSR